MSEASSSTQDEARYRIGAVCSLTGLSQHVLRVWEKRYRAVEPERGENRQRLYRESDIGRLALLKALVDRGHAIGSIADLDTAELERRVRQTAASVAISGATDKPRLALIGGSLAPVRADCAASEIFTLVDHADEISAFGDRDPAPELDVAVVEWHGLHVDSGVELSRLAAQLNARYLILVYDYAPRNALQRLPRERITALRSPLDIAALEAVVAWRFGVSARHEAGYDTIAGLPPARQFNDRELAHLAAQRATIACECPMHLAQLVTRLVRFELYSAECESRNAEDAALHGYLHATTARARSMMERALTKVVEMENLSSLPES